MHLLSHQQKIIAKFPKRAILVWSTGAGKTLAAIELAKKTKQPTLIIVPKALRLNWQYQVEDEPFLVITKEVFRRDWQKLGNYPTVIVDEAHYFFGTKTAMMKSLKGYFKKWLTPQRYFLTATPYRSTPMDIFIMCELLGYPMNYSAFKQKFFFDVTFGRRTIAVPRKNIEEDVAHIIHQVGSVVRLEDVVDVPEQTFITEYFELTKEQKQAIEDIDDFLPIVRYTKEHQICGGTLKGDEYSPSEYFPSDKIERLKELTIEHPKIIVVCRYNHEITRLTEELEGVYFINGDVPGDKRHELLDHLKHQDRYVLAVNAACSEGWELPDCPLMVFFSYSFSLKDYLQMLGRIQRINNIKKNIYLSLTVKGTIDEAVYESLKKKENFQIEIYAQTRSDI